MMTLAGWIGGLAFIAAIVVVMAARWVSKRNVLSGREPINIEIMYEKDATELDVSYETFSQVLTVVGESFRLDPKLLRLSDKLKKLYDLDSWELGEGIEQLNKRVANEFGITEFDIEPTTIAELVLEVQKRQTSHN